MDQRSGDSLSRPHFFRLRSGCWEFCAQCNGSAQLGGSAVRRLPFSASIFSIRGVGFGIFAHNVTVVRNLVDQRSGDSLSRPHFFRLRSGCWEFCAQCNGSAQLGGSAVRRLPFSASIFSIRGVGFGIFAHNVTVVRNLVDQRSGDSLSRPHFFRLRSGCWEFCAQCNGSAQLGGSAVRRLPFSASIFSVRGVGCWEFCAQCNGSAQLGGSAVRRLPFSASIFSVRGVGFWSFAHNVTVVRNLVDQRSGDSLSRPQFFPSEE